MRMRLLSAVLVVFLVAACGKTGHSSRGGWPAALVALENFPSAEHSRVEEAVKQLNERALRPILMEQGTTGGGYPVTIRFREPWPEAPNRAGYATIEDDRCTVEISSVLFEATFKDYLFPVIWHEVGHCAGLEHIPQEGEVMYKYSGALGSYTEGAIQRFFGTLLSQAGLPAGSSQGARRIADSLPPSD